MSSAQIKILARDSLPEVLETHRAAGRKVGFTSGAFDLLHAGHVDYLEKAKALVDVLVVGVNSDSSVQGNKGPARPINRDFDRARVVSGLASVDYVFIFDELNNNQNVTVIKPDLYIKASDYDAAGLSSKALVESFGGEVKFVDFMKGRSSSGIISTIETNLISKTGAEVSYDKRPAAFVDRDGTINVAVDYLHNPDQFEFIEGALDGLRKLREAGFRIVVITNQPGIGLGYFTREDLFRVNSRMLKGADSKGVVFDRIYYCPHSKGENCHCRKPGTLLIERAVKDLNIDLQNSVVIGDMTLDVMLAKNLNIPSILVETGRAGDDRTYDINPTWSAKNLCEAADITIREIGSFGKIADKFVGSDSQSDSQHMMELLGKFGGGLGHDFSNVFGAIKGCLDLIRHRLEELSGAENTTLTEIVSLAEKATDKGMGITDRLRAFARPGEIKRSRISLRSCVESVVDLLGKTRSKHEVEVVFAEDFEVEIADFTVNQMLLQLFHNSLDAMNHLKERFIWVVVDKADIRASDGSSLKPGKYAKLSITDHGKGITPEHRSAMFNPFFSTKSRGIGKGMGLSMSMAKAVMHKHGGDLVVGSTPGVGTTIALYFPLSADNA